MNRLCNCVKNTVSLNKTFEIKQETIDEITAREAAQKVRFESRLERESRAVLNQVRRAASAFYSATGQLLDANDFDDEWSAILRQHYRRVGNAYDSTLRDQINAESEQFNPETLDIVNSERVNSGVVLGVAGLVASRVPRSVQNISRTTQNDLNRSLTAAVSDLLIDQPEGAQLTDRAIGQQLGRRFAQTSAGRPSTIAMTETGTASESSRNIESEVINTQASGMLAIRKMWITVGDLRVRPLQGGNFDHVSADRQLVRENEPFIVSGERLMFPTDQSLGASLGNVINCRCVATRFAQQL